MGDIEKDIRERITDYPWRVLDGKEIACNWVKLSCKRFVDFLHRDDMYFDIDDVEKTIRFFSHFKHFVGQYADKPFLLEEWQKFIICGVYGFRWKETNLRVVKTFILSVGRKCGKTSLVSIMAIKALLETKGAQVICSANSASQANLLQTMASNYLKSLGKKSDKLFKRYRDRIMFPKTESYIKVVSNSPERLDGLNCNFFVADETSQAVDSKVWDVLDTSRGSRLESLAVACTTRSSNQSGFYRELETSAMNVLNGTVDDDTIFALIYTLDDGDDYEDEKVWKKCAPNLDISVYSDFYREQINKIKTTPSMTSAIMEKVFNVWTSSSNVWIPMDYIYKSMDNVDIKDYKDYLCYLSYDLASTSDLSCVTALFNVDDKFIFKTWYFLPRETLKTSVNKEKYKLWEREKYLIVTEGNVTDYDYIFNQIMRINKECEGVIRISYDTWNSTSLAIKLTEEGFNMQPYSQSIGSMNLPTKQLERLIMQGSNIIIDKNPITAWCFGNAVAKSDWNDNQKIIKESYDNKIDGVVSMIMGYGGYLQDSNYGNITLEGVSFS